MPEPTTTPFEDRMSYRNELLLKSAAGPTDEAVPEILPLQTYEAVLGEYSRGFGEAPHGTTTFQARDLDEAKKIADKIARDSNPDTYVVEVKLKPA